MFLLIIPWTALVAVAAVWNYRAWKQPNQLIEWRHDPLARWGMKVIGPQAYVVMSRVILLLVLVLVVAVWVSMIALSLPVTGLFGR